MTVTAAQGILLADRQGDVTRLTLNRPGRGNALSAELVTALAAAVDACYLDGTRLLAIEGAGEHFCTGFDLGDLDSESDDSLLARFVRVELLLQSVHDAPFATVALVQGRAMGAGADLVAACEQRWIAQGSSFAFPGAAFGLVLGSARLARLVGTARAREWIAAGRAVRADDALAAGLASRMIPAEERAAALAGLAERARRLDAPTQAAIQAATLGGQAAVVAAGAAQLSELVRSAARPGLRARIAAYREASRR
ncbi:enoyl-CoA hydratase/isomerase family protein [Cupriavidus basilensis]|uniref:Enoyl-CoA hydratase/isomerase family protein n=1 Tax=Cupriavidus basilensis TaxID=68895 RepID=A0ABT6AR29_9BURK|nr:enoyl-CoA hydratase/isomerase family protein [Cupriavidus basilensis]MDF3835085.1 enoyl-CoA hydratase/isomerase family protein [Cupriavidus basilensis]